MKKITRNLSVTTARVQLFDTTTKTIIESEEKLIDVAQENLVTELEKKFKKSKYKFLMILESETQENTYEMNVDTFIEMASIK